MLLRRAALAASRVAARRTVLPPARTAAVRWLSAAAQDAAAAADPDGTVVADAAASAVEAAVAESAVAMSASASPVSDGVEEAPSPPAARSSSRSGAHPSSAFRVRMLKAIRDQAFENVISEYEQMVEAGVAPDTLTLNCIVEATAQMNGATAAKETFESLVGQHEALQPNAQTYVALIKPFERRGETEGAFALYEEAKAKGVPLHVDLYNTLVSTCCEARDFEAAQKLFAEMREQGVKPRSNTYLRYIYACFRARDADKAYEMLVSMENEWRVPDRKDYARLMNQFKWNNHQEGKMRCLKAIMLDLKGTVAPGGGSTAPDVASLDPEVIGGLFREAQERRRPDEILQLADTFASAGIRLDRFQQLGVIFAHFHMDQPVDAFSKLVALYEGGHKLPPRVHADFAEELSKSTDIVDEAYYVLEQRKEQGASVPLPAINMIIEACAAMGDLDRAFATWAELESFGLSSDAGTYNALLATCIKTRELASGRRLLMRMQQEDVAADADTFYLRCSMHIMQREHGPAMAVLDECRAEGLAPPARMYAALITMFCRARKRETARELLAAMENEGHKIGAKLRGRVEELGA